MTFYSRLQLLSLRYWYKTGLQYTGLQISRHGVGFQETKPLCSSVWSSFKQLGILKQTRGKRGGRKRSLIESTDIISKEFGFHNIPTVMHRRFHRSSKAASNYNRYSRCLTPVNIQSTENTILKSNFGLWNARSLRNKTASICDFIISEKISILALTETWLFGDEHDNSTIATITNCLPHFNITHRARAGRGGGVCIMHHKGLIAKSLILQSFTSFEYLDLVISSGSVSVRLINAMYIDHQLRKDIISLCILSLMSLQTFLKMLFFVLEEYS